MCVCDAVIKRKYLCVMVILCSVCADYHRAVNISWMVRDSIEGAGACNRERFTPFYEARVTPALVSDAPVSK